MEEDQRQRFDGSSGSRFNPEWPKIICSGKRPFDIDEGIIETFFSSPEISSDDQVFLDQQYSFTADRPAASLSFKSTVTHPPLSTDEDTELPTTTPTLPSPDELDLTLQALSMGDEDLGPDEFCRPFARTITLGPKNYSFGAQTGSFAIENNTDDSIAIKSAGISSSDRQEHLSELQEPLLGRPRSSTDNLIGSRRILKPKKLKAAKNFGVKTIGQKSSFVYLVNQIFGTGVIAIPRVFTLSGWLPCLVADIFVCLAAWLGTLMTLRCMTLVEGNQNFERRLEYMNIISRYLHKPYYKIIQWFFYLSIFASNVVSIIVVAQSCDNILSKMTGFTPALLMVPSPHFKLVRDVSLVYGSEDDSERSLQFSITLGYILTAAACIPLSLETMDENMKVQYLSFAVLLATLTGLAVTSCFTSSNSIASAAVVSLLYSRGSFQRPAKYANHAAPTPQRRQLGVSPNALGHRQYGELMSTFLASFSCVNVIPSWANEMSWDVDVNRVVAQGLIFSCLVYYLFGYCMVYSMQNIQTDNVLQELLDSRGDIASPLTSVLVYAFDLITVAPGILVYCITTRYNIMTEWGAGAGLSALDVKTLHTRAVFLSSILPFLLAWLVSDASHFSAFLSWSSLVFSLTVNFIAPLLIFLVACAVSPLSHKNPVLHMTKNRVQILLLSFAGRISALVANRELLELPEPAVLTEDCGATQQSEARKHLTVQVNLPSQHSTSEVVQTHDQQCHDREITSQNIRANLASTFLASDSHFQSVFDAFSSRNKMPACSVLQQIETPGLNPSQPSIANTPTFRVFTPKPMKSGLMDERSSIVSVETPPLDSLPLITTAWPTALQEQSSKLSTVVSRNKRPRGSVVDSTIGLIPVKIPRRFHWDSVGSRKRQMTAKVVKQKLEHSIPVAKALEQIAPLAIKAKHGSKLLPTSYKQGISPWSGHRRGAADFVWAISNRDGYAAQRFGERSATYARSVAPPSLQKNMDFESSAYCEPLTTKSAFELRRHNTASIQRESFSAYFRSGFSTSEDSESVPPVSINEPYEETARPRPTTYDSAPVTDRVAIVINSPSTAVCGGFAITRDNAPPPISLTKTLAAPSADRAALSSEELSNDTSSCRSRKYSMTLSYSGSKPRKEGSRFLGCSSARAAARTPSPLSVRFADARSGFPGQNSDSSISGNASPHPSMATYRRRRISGRRQAEQDFTEYLVDSSELDALRGSAPVEDSADDEDLASSETNFISNAEDAYAQDEDLFGDLESIRIRVFPKGFLRRNHVEFTSVVLVILIVSCAATALDKFINLVALAE